MWQRHNAHLANFDVTSSCYLCWLAFGSPPHRKEPSVSSGLTRGRNKPRAGSIANSLTLSRQGGRWLIPWLGTVRHNRINRGKGRSTDTLIVVVFGRIGGERGGAERNPSADYGNGGGQVGREKAVGGRQVVRVADGRIQHIDVQVEIAEGSANGALARGPGSPSGI